MIIASRYTVERAAGGTAYRIRNLDAPLCPACGRLLSGYDTRARHVIDGSGTAHWFRLRCLRCSACRRIHLELPDFMQARKHYEADVIGEVIAGRLDVCPADASTMRRWRLKNHPPGLPSPPDNIAV